ncbi:MAG: GNAT family N-acetyltransferase [Proteobacteria bacterium]|nr:GNAT family N-acetyltransferase [Pseudomonadota bacterium]
MEQQHLTKDDTKQVVDIKKRELDTVEVISNFEAFVELASEWNSLLDKSSANCLFLTHEWLSNWWLSYHAKRQESSLAIITVREAGVLVGAAPIMLNTVKEFCLKVTKASFIGDPTWTTGDFIVAKNTPSALNKLAERLLKLKWTVMELGCIPEASASLSVITEILGSRRMRSSSAPSASSPYLRVESDWESFYAARSTRFKKALRNKQNKIKKAGEYEVHQYRTEEELTRVLPSVMELAKKGWKHQIENSIASDNGNSSFYTAMATRVNRDDFVNIWILSLQSTPIAYEYHFSYNNITYGITADYDTEHKNLSPGSILDFNIVKSKFDESGATYDLGCGDSFYKKNWTKETNRYFNITAYSNSLYGAIVGLIATKIYPAAKRLYRKEAETIDSGK